MSYEPQIIVLASDIAQFSEIIQNDYNWDFEDVSVMVELKEVLQKYTPVKIGYEEYYLFRPELTSFNLSVREKLDELGVTYYLDSN